MVTERREWPNLRTSRKFPGTPRIEPATGVQIDREYETYVPESAANVLTVEEARRVLLALYGNGYCAMKLSVDGVLDRLSDWVKEQDDA
jgi:hypothetical protein